MDLAELSRKVRRSLGLTQEQFAAKLFFQRPDGAGKRGLRDLATLRCTRKIQFLRHRKEIANLLHSHGEPMVLQVGWNRRYQIGKPCKRWLQGASSAGSVSRVANRQATIRETPTPVTQATHPK